MNLLILEPREVDDAGEVRLSGPRATHLLHVLKVVAGQEVRVGLLDGPRGVGVVQSTDGGTVSLRCGFGTGVPTMPRVDLLLALPRPKVMRRLWSQLAALGVGHILITNADRVERHYFDTHILTPESYRPLLIEGLQQACDTRLPLVSIHRQFRRLIEDDLDRAFAGGLRLIADPAATGTVGAMVGEGRFDRLMLAIGPEGGWNDFERRLLEVHGFQGVGMGARTLRTDTACVALLALVHAAIATQVALRSA